MSARACVMRGTFVGIYGGNLSNPICIKCTVVSKEKKNTDLYIKAIIP